MVTNYFIFLLANLIILHIKTLKKTVRWVVGIVLGVYIGTIIMLNIPYIQQRVASIVAGELSQVLNTQLTIGKIDLGLLNRIIIDDVMINDQRGSEMLKVKRLSVKFDIASLFKGKISINNIQLFGFNIQLNKQTPHSTSNYQFFLDALKSDKKDKESEKLDFRVNSVLIRRGKLSYDILSEKQTPGKFNPQHIRLQNIIANISMKALQNDSINLAIKRLSAEELESGFYLKKLALKLVANEKRMNIENLGIELNSTSIKMDTIRMTYDSIQAFNHFTDKVHFSFRTLPSYITLKDISPFVPALSHFKEPILLDMDVKGTVNQFTCSKLQISDENEEFRLNGDVTFQDLSTPENTFVFGKLSELSATNRGTGFLVRNLSQNYNGIPPILDNLGNIFFRGEVSGYFTDLVTYGVLRTSRGTVSMDLKLSSEKSKGMFAYSGAVSTKELDLGKILSDPKLGKATFNLKVNGTHIKDKYPSINLKGLVSSIDYSSYNYENISLDAEYKNGGFKGNALLDDPNGYVHLNGAINMASKRPTFNFTAVADGIRPNDLKLTPKYKDTEISVRVKANLTGNSFDNMIGEINIDSLKFEAPNKNYFLKNLKIEANKRDKENRLTLTSEFMTGTIEGNYQYHTLPASIINTMQRYVPSLVSTFKKPQETHNNFNFDFNIYNTEMLPVIFDIPLKIQTHSTLKGYFNDEMKRIRIEGYFPRLQYENNLIESGLVLCENESDNIHAKVRFTNRKKTDASSVSLDAKAKDDVIQTTINWGNNAAVTYGGQLSAVAKFLRTQGKKPVLKTVVDLKPTDIIINDTIWKIHPSQIVVDSGKVDVKNFYFSHRNRYIRANGCISSNPLDTVKLELKKINMNYIFDIVGISEDVNFGGDATGIASASGILKKPVLNANLFIQNFSLNEGRLGDLNVYAAWENDIKGLFLDAKIADGSYQSHVSGHIFPLKPESGLDLNIDADHLNLKFLEYYMSDIAKDIKGYGTGRVHFYGKFKGLNLDGKVMTDASMKFDFLNTRFGVKDTIHLAPTGLTFNNIKMVDVEGHEGTLDGYLHFEHFKNIQYRFEAHVNNMLVINTKETSDMPFYGKIYGTGNAILSGNAAQGLEANIGLKTDRNSTFTYINGNTMSATNTGFIKFVDKTPRRAIPDSINLDPENYNTAENEDNQHSADIRLNMQLDVTPDAAIKILMDPLGGDYITAKGNGNMRVEFYNKGEVKMFGNYQIKQGVYKFNLQEVIRKDFVIKDGSNITFSGAPLDANLGIQASYTVNSASLNDLFTDGSNLAIQQPNVKVNCIMNLTGNLLRPNIKLDLELPNERDEIQTLVRNYISTDEQMNMQILYLLSIGKFYTESKTSDRQNSNVMTSVLSSTLSGQLNNALSQVLENNNWNIGTNISTGEKGWTDVEVEGILSGQMLNNRLLINGNFGYRDNPLSNTNFVGDFVAEWLLTRSGDIRLKAYNKTNDRYYTKTNLTTQGIGIMYKKDFNKWQELFFWNNWISKKKRKQQTNEKLKKQPIIAPNKETDDTKPKSAIKRERE